MHIHHGMKAHLCVCPVLSHLAITGDGPPCLAVLAKATILKSQYCRAYKPVLAVPFHVM